MWAVRLFWPGGIAIALMGLASGCSCDLGKRSCSSDLQCGPGAVCDRFLNECKIPACTSDEDCGRDKVCTVSYECQTGCRSDDGCPAGFICADDSLDNGLLKCRPGCRSDVECAPGMVCGGTAGCQVGCRSHADCQPGTYCPTGNGPLSFWTPRRCKPGCHDDGECAQGQLCSYGACHLRCEEASDCGMGGYCAALHALGSVRSDAGLPIACGAGERCACVREPGTTGGPRPNPNQVGDGGADAGNADAGKDAP